MTDKILFKLRKYLFLVPLLFIIMNHHNLHYPDGDNFIEEVTEAFMFLLLIVGVFPRFLISGLFRRQIVKRNGEVNLLYRDDKSIIFSIYLISDFLIYLALSLMTFNFVQVFLCSLLFFAVWIPLIYSRRQIVMDCLSKKDSPCSKLFTHLGCHLDRFRWAMAIRKEGLFSFLMIQLFLVMEQVREFSITGSFNTNLLWVSVGFLSVMLLVFYLSTRSRIFLPDMPFEDEVI